MPVSAPQPQPVSPTSTPFYGTLEIPSQDDDGPPDGLTLDRAIDITLEQSRDLRAKFYEIPMARADTLQASLRSNPVFYQDGQLLQYHGSSTQFTRAAPGGPSQFDTNISYPLDVSHKRQARTAVATRAERVLEAQYQDAVRNRIDDVYGAYATALGARQTVRYANQSVKALEKLTTLTEQLRQNGQISQADLNLVKIKLRIARLGSSDAEAAYRRARLDLGALMNLPNDEARSMELRGTISDRAPQPPPLDELSRTALESRPDVISFRLGIDRAQADVRLARANAFSDVYVLWQPYTFQDNSPYGLKSQYSWALGVTVPLPIYNRNQGGIQRAMLNVDQSQIQLSDLERQVRIDVEKAVHEYEVSLRLVADLRNEVIPEAQQVRDAAFRMWTGGETSLIAYLMAQLDFNDVVKRYIDTALRHRQSMLSLNTSVGRRILP
jgi:cobalt-zinc-cadmium efflux system outer membrane protein